MYRLIALFFMIAKTLTHAQEAIKMKIIFKEADGKVSHSFADHQYDYSDYHSDYADYD